MTEFFFNPLSATLFGIFFGILTASVGSAWHTRRYYRPNLNGGEIHLDQAPGSPWLKIWDWFKGQAQGFLVSVVGVAFAIGLSLIGFYIIALITKPLFQLILEAVVEDEIAPKTINSEELAGSFSFGFALSYFPTLLFFYCVFLPSLEFFADILAARVKQKPIASKSAMDDPDPPSS